VTPERRHDPKPVRRADAAVFVLFAACGFALASWASRLVMIRETLGVDPARMGLLLLCWSVGSIVSMPLSGWLVVRFGGRRVLAVFGCVALVGLVGAGAAAQARSQAGVAALLVVLGVGVGTWDVSMNLAGTDVERALRRTALPRYHAGYSLGTVLAGLAGAALARLGLPVLAHFGLAAALCFGALAWGVRGLLVDGAAAAVRPPPESGAAGPRARSRGSAWTEPRTLLIGLMMLALSLAEGAAGDWLASGIVQGFRAEEAIGIVGLTVFLTAQTAMRLFGTRLVDRFGRPASVRASGVSAIAGVMLYALAPSLPLALVGCALWGVGAALVFPLGMSAAADDPVRAAQRTSVVATIGYGAFLTGPPLLGLLADHVGFRHAMLVLAAPIAIAVAVAAVARQETSP
jgi:MFS family permease